VVHPAVFLPQAKEEFPHLSWSRISRSPLRLPDGSGYEDRYSEMTFLGRVLAVTGITGQAIQITYLAFREYLMPCKINNRIQFLPWLI
jgi:hypothetical protein